MKWSTGVSKPLLLTVIEQIAAHGEAHLYYLTEPTIDYLRDKGYRVTTWGIHTLVSARSHGQDQAGSPATTTATGTLAGA